MILAILFALSAAHSEPVCAKGSIALRTDPKASAEVSWRVAKHMPLLRLSRKKEWSKVQDLEGDTHWVKTSDVTNSYRCVVVQTNIAALHREPSKAAPADGLKTVDRFTPFKRVGDRVDWLQVEDESGQRAWVHESQVWKPVMINSFTF